MENKTTVPVTDETADTRYTLTTSFKRLLADTYTPVSIYLKLRDKFPNSILLESSDYHGNENSFSYICCKPIASFSVEQDAVITCFPDGKKQVHSLKSLKSVPQALRRFAGKFQTQQPGFKFISNGLFGYMNYDAVTYFEDIQFHAQKSEGKNIPDVRYSIYRFVIAINHFKNELYIFDNCYEPDTTSLSIDTIETLINNKNFASYRFQQQGGEKSNFTDEEFLKIIAKGKEHCNRGDVFQVVLSREFSQAFQGDEFNVYRALRSINPSPYLFYFDYGNYKLFGSSPEAQIVIQNSRAFIYPIAGTFKRTGDDEADASLAKRLESDSKENAEHVMLVDLARNDLSRNCSDVQVEIFKEVQYYSHVIHLVSKVSGTIHEDSSGIEVVAQTFPAGTLSGAPKYKAMQLIDKYEKGSRQFYGGCIGYMGFNGDFNHAIIIRSFLSKNNVLYYQAGAGVVAASQDLSELNEVNNKLLALKKAIEMARDI